MPQEIGIEKRWQGSRAQAAKRRGLANVDRDSVTGHRYWKNGPPVKTAATIRHGCY